MRTAEFIAPIVPGVFSNPTLTVDSQGLVVGTAGGATFAQCIVKRSGSVSVGSNTDLPFNSVVLDPLGMFDGTATITIPTAGRYLVCYNAALNGPAITPTSLRLCNAGVNIGAETFGVPNLNLAQYFSTASLFNFVGGETLTIRNVQNTQTCINGRFAVIQMTS